jgi:hypothetical protein
VSELLKELERIEDMLGIPLCVHNDNGKKITIYRVYKGTVGNLDDQNLEKAIEEIKDFLEHYYSPKIKIVISRGGITLKEANSRQAAWNMHCDMLDAFNG